ncbi:MAG: type III-A CRISPR-associated protein Csm2 [Candidatus Aenigmarchaeota archaeon]|nr:type III-A CRISPR-associated protein Csm2 [Candidatus Aenigmarchaeota archaeon]
MNKYEQEKREIEIDLNKIFQEEDPEKFLNYIKSLNNLISEISSNQIRNFFDQVKKISIKSAKEEDIKKHVLKLTIMVEYAKNKESTRHYKNFYEIMLKCLDYLMKNPKQEKYIKFQEFLEALIAFYAKK